MTAILNSVKRSRRQRLYIIELFNDSVNTRPEFIGYSHLIQSACTEFIHTSIDCNGSFVIVLGKCLPSRAAVCGFQYLYTLNMGFSVLAGYYCDNKPLFFRIGSHIHRGGIAGNHKL